MKKLLAAFFGSQKHSLFYLSESFEVSNPDKIRWKYWKHEKKYNLWFKSDLKIVLKLFMCVVGSRLGSYCINLLLLGHSGIELWTRKGKYSPILGSEKTWNNHYNFCCSKLENFGKFYCLPNLFILITKFSWNYKP